MNLKKHTLAVCVVAVLTGANSIANTEAPKKFTYKKALSTLTVQQAPTDPVWDLSTNVLNFGELAQGQEATLSVGLQNTGAVLISAPSILTTGTGFLSSHNCNSVSAGQICAINVIAQGQGGGADLAGVLSVSIGGVTKNVTLSGNSAFYNFTVSPSVLDFGTNYVGSSVTQQFSLTNTGNKSITIPALISSDPHVNFSHSCGTLAPQQSCVITAVASNSGASVVQANANITSSGVTRTVEATANFVQATATLQPQANSSFDFGNQDLNQAKTQYYTFANTSPLALSNVVVNNPSNSTLVSNNCGTTLNAGGSCDFGITWQPSTYADFSGTLTVSSAEVTKTASLQGKVKQSTATLQTGSLVLGDVAQYSTSANTLTFKNSGTANMTVTALSGLPAAMTLSNNTCSNIAPNSTCTMLVTLNTNSTTTQSTLAVTPVGANNSTPINVSYNVVASNTSCATIKSGNASLTSGTYTIDPDGTGGAAPVSVYCDMTTDGGGWTRVSNIDEALKAGTLTTVTISDMGLSYTKVLMVAKSNMMTKYANENTAWWSTGINPATHGLKFGSSWYFLANPTAWRGYGGDSNSPYGVNLPGGVSWANSNYTTITANPGGSYCNLNGVAQSFCGKAIKVNVPSGLKLTGFNDIESLYPSTGDNQSTRALEIYVK